MRWQPTLMVAGFQLVDPPSHPLVAMNLQDAGWSETLVRDRIPEIIKVDGKYRMVRVLDDVKYRRLLNARRGPLGNWCRHIEAPWLTSHIE
jgi:hypothetical protein